MTDSTDQKPPNFSHQHGIYEFSASLNFCCPAIFLLLHPREENELIALRFGCSARSVRRWRHLPLKCERSESCLLPRFACRFSLSQLRSLTPPESDSVSNPPTPT